MIRFPEMDIMAPSSRPAIRWGQDQVGTYYAYHTVRTSIFKQYTTFVRNFRIQLTKTEGFEQQLVLSLVGHHVVIIILPSFARTGRF